MLAPPMTYRAISPQILPLNPGHLANPDLEMPALLCAPGLDPWLLESRSRALPWGPLTMLCLTLPLET